MAYFVPTFRGLSFLPTFRGLLFLCHVGLFLVAAWDFLSWSPPPQALVAAEVASFGGSY